MPDTVPPTLDPATTPQDIERRSFALIDAAVPEPRPFAGQEWELARRLIHTSGDVALAHDIRITPNSVEAGGRAIEAGVRALRAGCAVYTDTEMARVGMTRLARLGIAPVCMLTLPDVAARAQAQGITRSRAGMQALAGSLAGAIVAIGNAPTALLALLEMLDAGAPAPALIIGVPVGFVNAAESKELLHRSPYTHITIRGNKGGSTLAAAAVNALALLA